MSDYITQEAFMAKMTSVKTTVDKHLEKMEKKIEDQYSKHGEINQTLHEMDKKIQSLVDYNENHKELMPMLLKQMDDRISRSEAKIAEIDTDMKEKVDKVAQVAQDTNTRVWYAALGSGSIGGGIGVFSLFFTRMNINSYWGITIIFLVILVFLLVFLIKKSVDNSDVVYVNCDSFKTQQEAQEYFLENNATHLDGDKDGIACEHLTPIERIIERVKSIQNEPKSTQSEPQTIEVVGEAKVIVEERPTPQPTPTNRRGESTSTATPESPTPTPVPSSPSPTPSLICLPLINC